ncbi:MAG: hypothetical protein WD847_16550 [Pirellulales bacterium]
MAERRWYRLHGVTLIGLCIVCAALAWSDWCGRKRIHVYATGTTVSTTVYGWPFTHIGYNLQEWWSCPWHNCPWWNCRALNLAIQLAAIAAVGFVLETWLRSNNRLQVRLLTLLILTAVFSVVFALAQFERPTLVGCESDPTGSVMHWPVQVPTLFALGCTIYTAGWLVARLAPRSVSALRSLVALCFKD